MSTHPNVSRDGDTWPPRPVGEIFPEIMDSLDVAMLLRYDSRPGSTPEKGRRMVRVLVRDNGLPTLGKVGRLFFRKSKVLAWLDGRNLTAPDGAADSPSEGRSVSVDRTTTS